MEGGIELTYLRQKAKGVQENLLALARREENRASIIYFFSGGMSESGCDQCHGRVASKVNLGLVIRRETSEPTRVAEETSWIMYLGTGAFRMRQHVIHIWGCCK